MALFALPLLRLGLAAPAAAASCKDAADCGYLGECGSAGACVCEHPWTGPECNRLALADAAPGLHETDTSTWGGSVLHGDDGRLYMYSAEMVAHCGIQSWTRNSRVIVASADNAGAPFRFERELFGVFSHEPAAARAPTGEYVVYFTTTTLGCGTYGACVPAKICSGMGNGSTCNPGGPVCWTNCTGTAGTPEVCHDARTEASPLTRFPTYMSYAMHPLGPFSTPVMVYNGSDGGGALRGYPFPPATGDTNMAGVILNDGSLVGMWRGDRKSFDVKPNVIQFEYSMRAKNWKDPSTYEWGHAVAANNIFPSIVPPGETRTCGIEDPTLWLDSKGIVHAVVHNFRAGGHAASADRGKTWRWYGGNCSAKVGPASIDWSRSVWPESFAFATAPGKMVTPSRRERPHCIVDPKTKRVTAVTNALQLGEADITQTLVQPVADKARDPLKMDDADHNSHGSLPSGALPPRQTHIQEQLVAKLTANAALASSRATPKLLAALGDRELSRLLTQRGLPELAALPPAELLVRLRAEAAVSEITHNLAIGNGSVGRHQQQPCIACDGWAPGDDGGMSRTPLMEMETLPSLWTLGELGYVSPSNVAGWMRGADSVECGILGCPRFTGALPSAARDDPPARPPYWPRDSTEARTRPIYAVLDLHKLDVGVPDFGPVAIVMNRSSIAPLTALMPADMGLWAPACRCGRLNSRSSARVLARLFSCSEACSCGASQNWLARGLTELAHPARPAEPSE
jgi:hypothetical protein